jgi:hypothetical protein
VLEKETLSLIEQIIKKAVLDIKSKNTRILTFETIFLRN